MDAAWRRVGLDIRLALARAEPTASASIMEPRQPSPTTALRYPTLPYLTTSSAALLRPADIHH